MIKNKFIAEAELKAAEIEPMRIESTSVFSSEAPYFVDHVEKMLEGKYETRALHTEGMKVYTTLDLSMQRAANKAIYEGLNSLDAKLRLSPYAEASSERRTDPLSYPQAALVALEPQTGFIRAMVGGRDYGSSQFNRSIQAQRQPGSAFKPFVFAAAFNASLVTPSKIISDEPWSLSTSSGIWKPDNYDEDFNGEVTLRNVLIHSINVPTAKLLYYTVGIRRTIQLAKKMGITSPLAPYPALALGSSVVTLLELSSAYGVFANRGVRLEPVAIKYVQSRTGEILEEFQPQAQKVLEENVAYLMTDLMKGVINEGTARRLRAMGFKRIAAGKTGTTNNKTDASFIGYIPTLVAGVWTGYDDPQKSVRHTGGEVAAPIWANFMEQAAKAADQDFPVPSGIVFKEVDANTGLLASRRCGRVIREAFIEGMEPTRICNAHN
jgi:membrane carboxypeptidase/penicillin-binding protein